MILRAHAKINLTLEVLGKRPDGYHEIRSVMRTLALHDTISIEPAEALEVICSIPALSSPRNLAHQAAALLRDQTSYDGGARIMIQKAIPVAGGLGGGSSDGASTLVGLNALWRTNLSLYELAALAARLGSDVPFFLYGSMAIASGRGERLQPLPALPDCSIVLINPGVTVSTTAIYQKVTPPKYSDGAVTEQLAGLPSGAPPATWPLTNSLQSITAEAYPVVAEVLELLPDWGAIQHLMCGSGSTCFGLFADEITAIRAAQHAQVRGWSAWVTHFE